MIIYVTIKKQEIRLDYLDLAKKMWYKERNGVKIEKTLNHTGNTEMLQASFSLTLSLSKWDDARWQKKSHKNENIYLHPTNPKKINELEFSTDHKEIVTLDKRALFIMVLEVAKEVAGKISEDSRKTWITPQEFEKKHQKILSLDYEMANEISLQETDILSIEEEDPAIYNQENSDYLDKLADYFETHKLTLHLRPERLGMKIDFLKLAEKMWYPSIAPKDLDVIDYNENQLVDYFYLALKRKKDYQYLNPDVKIPKYCVLSLNDDEENVIKFYTTFTDILTVDKRAIYMMLVEVAKQTGGDISENEMKTWISLKEFEQKYAQILSLSYDEAIKLSK